MKLAQEQVIENEEALILDAYNVVRKSLEKKYANTEMLRRFHAKGLGLVAATLTVFDDIPEHLRTGLFETPKTFNAWIRFSNAQPKVLDDKKKAPRGMAIKVLEASTSNLHDDPMGANTQDLVLTTNEILFPGTVKLYLQSLKGLFGNFLYMIPILLNPCNWKGAYSIFKGKKRVANVLEENYFSATPYLFGQDKAVKWHVKPLKAKTSTIPKNPSANFLTQRLSADLSTQSATFELYAQFQSDPTLEPIEDTSVQWKTPLVKLATIHIPSQTFDTDERNKMSEQMRFSPWHCLPEHRPLGGNNRVRKVLYQELAKLRSEWNKVN